jgi:uncharacterized membrane protein YozB (DUF420 family)
MIPISDLPAVNAGLNALSSVLLFCGWRAIRRGDRRRHARWMLSAVGTSTLFLISYLTYHFSVTALTRFPEAYPVARRIYLGILATHTILAAATLPLVILVLVAALRGRFDRHRRLARWTLPIWGYVSVTGVVIYVLLYHVYRP